MNVKIRFAELRNTVPIGDEKRSLVAAVLVLAEVLQSGASEIAESIDRAGKNS